MLINETQISLNLRRAAEKGIIALLNRKRLENLALKYFGVYKDNELIGYRCPYSGKVYTDYKDIVLEHIIPVSSNGGTVLFNCIPTSSEVNGLDEKGAKHLIEWWTHSKYWDEDAPIRLESLVNYIIEGYNHVFDEYTIEELETSYLDILNEKTLNEEELNEEDNLRYSKRKEITIVKEQTESNKIYSYLTFLNDCIEVLDKHNIDTTTIKDNLKRLEERNIFKEIDKYTLYQNTLKKVIANILGDDNKAYLTYSLNIDIKKLMSIINEDEEEYIYKSLYTRFNNINIILKQNNLSIIDYFKNLMDIEDINLLYKNKVSQQEITEFIESIKLGHDSKINIFIEMLNDNKTMTKDNQGKDILRCFQILKSTNQETFEGFPNTLVGHFFRNNNKDKIIHMLFEGELKDNPEFNIARSTILKYYKVGSIEEYYEKEKEKAEFKANLSKEEIEFQNDLDTKIKVFIEMLNDNKTITKDNQGNNVLRSFQILKSTNQETFEGFPNTIVGNFFRNNKNNNKIIKELFEGELKDNPNYDVARNTILKYHKVSSIEEYHKKEKAKEKYKANLSEEEKEFQNNLDARIRVFIEMLNDNKTMTKDNQGNEVLRSIQILKSTNQETFEGFPNTLVGHFYSSNDNKKIIINKLFEGELKDNPEFNIARNIIIENNFQNNLDARIRVFIEMLNDNKTMTKDIKGNDVLRSIQILNKRNQETFEGFPNTLVGNFFNNNNDKDKIIYILFEGELKDNPKYDVARNTILLKYYKVGSIEKYYEKEKEKVEFKVNLSKEEIEFQKNLDARIRVFIEMLNDNKTMTKDNQGNEVLRCFQILNLRNQEIFEGFPNTLVGCFYRKKNKDVIIHKLFEAELKDNPNYDVARNTILKYHKVSSIEEYYEKEKRKNEEQDKLSPEEIEFQSNPQKKINIFIEMLNDANLEILSSRNNATFKGYPHTYINNFWHYGNNRNIIIKKLFERDLKDNPNYDVARNTILKYHKVSSIEEYYKKEKNKEEYKTNLSEEEKKFQNDLDSRIKVFIEMLNDNTTMTKDNKGKEVLRSLRLFNKKNEEIFEGFPSTFIGQFYRSNDNKNAIIHKLFEGELKDNPEYDVARSTILKHHKVSSIEEYYEKEKKKKELKELKKLKKQAIEIEESIDKEDISNRRRA